MAIEFFSTIEKHITDNIAKRVISSTNTKGEVTKEGTRYDIYCQNCYSNLFVYGLESLNYWNSSKNRRAIIGFTIGNVNFWAWAEEAGTRDR